MTGMSLEETARKTQMALGWWKNWPCSRQHKENGRRVKYSATIFFLIMIFYFTSLKSAFGSAIRE